MLDLKDVWTEYHETGDRGVRERIIADCMPLVKYVVGKVAGGAPPHCDREELMESAIFGLIDAIERYDPGKEAKFETYAILRMCGAVIDELRSRDWVPRAKRKKARELEAIESKLTTRNGAVPTVDDLAKACGVSRREMADTLQEVSFVSFLSLDDDRSPAADTDGRGSRMADVLVDDRIDPPGSRIELEEQVHALARAITELPEQERVIITLYYYEDMRLKDIGKLYGVSESRICQLHGRALVLLKMRMQQLLGA